MAAVASVVEATWAAAEAASMEVEARSVEATTADTAGDMDLGIHIPVDMAAGEHMAGVDMARAARELTGAGHGKGVVAAETVLRAGMASTEMARRPDGRVQLTGQERAHLLAVSDWARQEGADRILRPTRWLLMATGTRSGHEQRADQQ